MSAYLKALQDDQAQIRAGMAALARRKWRLLTPEGQAAHILKMVAGQRRKRKHQKAKARKGKR